jgi:hypothetical protein
LPIIEAKDFEIGWWTHTHYYSCTTEFLQLMIGVHTSMNGALDPGTVISLKCFSLGEVPLITSTRPPTDNRAHLMPMLDLIRAHVF